MKVADIPDGWKKALMVPLVALMFDGTNEDGHAAWKQAIDYVRGFFPQTELEFRLIVRMAIFNLQANNASMLANRPHATTSQAIRLQANALALSKAADKAEARLKQLQSARIQRAKAAEQDAAPDPAPAPEPPKAQTAKDEARAINDYARKNRMTYAQAWAIHQRDKKAQPQAEVSPADTPQS